MKKEHFTSEHHKKKFKDPFRLCREAILLAQELIKSGHPVTKPDDILDLLAKRDKSDLND